MRNRQYAGFTLIEMSIVITLAIMLVAAGIWPQVVRLKTIRAEGQGDLLLHLSNSVATYTTNNYRALVSAQAVTGVANSYAPTVPELAALGLLSNNFSATNLYGSNYAIEIKRTPEGCLPEACDLTTLTTLTGAITDYQSKQIDGGALGSAVHRIGANAGFSTLATPGTIDGVGGTWSVANPHGSVAGILAVRGGYGASGLSQFLRRDGTLPMTGNLNMGNQDVHNAENVKAVALVTFGGASVGGTLNVAGATTTNGITNNGNVTNTGDLTNGGTLNVAGATTTNGITNNGNIVNTGNLTNGGTLNVAGTTTTNGITNNGNIVNSGDVTTGRLYLTTIVVEGAACLGFDGYQARTSTGKLVSCDKGVWTGPGSYTPPAASCAARTVGPWGGVCYGTASATTSGMTMSVSASSGGTGNATYLCTNGNWSYESGACTPTPASCPASTISWGACMGTAPAMASGASRTVSASSGGTGSTVATCNNGIFSQSSSTCTAVTAPCSSGQVVTWSKAQPAWNGNTNAAGTYTCMGTTTAASSGNTITVPNARSGNTGSATYLCSNGNWTAQTQSCDGATTSALLVATDNTSAKIGSCDTTCLTYIRDSLYKANLKRLPDSAGLNYWALKYTGSTTALRDVFLNDPAVASYILATNAAGHLADMTEALLCPNGYGYPWSYPAQLINTCKRYPN